MINKFQSAFICIRENGFAETFFRVLHYLKLVSVHHTLDFFIDEIGGKFLNQEAVLVLQIKEDKEPVRFIEIEKGELNKFKFEPDLQPLSWFEAQFAWGSRLFAAVHSGSVVAVNLMNPRYADLGHIKRPLIQLPQGIAYTHGSLTAKRYRGRDIATALKRFSTHISITTKQCFATAGAVFPDNEAAQNWHRNRLQSKYWGRIHYLKWGTREFWFKSLSSEGKKNPGMFDQTVSSVEIPDRSEASACLQ